MTTHSLSRAVVAMDVSGALRRTEIYAGGQLALKDIGDLRGRRAEQLRPEHQFLADHGGHIDKAGCTYKARKDDFAGKSGGWREEVNLPFSY
ncbi:MAG: hypothetical protein HYX26_08465 [Acidobacteriales bacterium]|nr:hypothetical protein [Terriglobales bacterium]